MPSGKLITSTCKMGHTPLTPAKADARARWLLKVRKLQDMTTKRVDVITISHGALDGIRYVGLTGQIVVCDVDPAPVAIAKQVSRAYRGSVNISAKQQDIRECVREYCTTMDSKKQRLGAVDIDLTESAHKCKKILVDILETLLAYNIRTRVLLTFSLRRDGFGKAHDERIESLLHGLPAFESRVFFVDDITYRSDENNRMGERERGACMGVLELQVS